MLRALLGLLLGLPCLARAADAPAPPPAAPRAASRLLPETVRFPSRDGTTALVGYLWRPAAPGRRPAVVLMHGRAGPYSSLARGRTGAEHLSMRHAMWGELLVREGYVVLLVDGFGPRGRPQGFEKGTYDARPAEFDEVSVRPLDAFGAHAWLARRPDVDSGRIALLGWSNGGSATLATLADDTPAGSQRRPGERFVAGVALYPACGLREIWKDGYRASVPIRVFVAQADDEVSPARCHRLVERSRALGGDITIHEYPGAVHGFDSPEASRQRVRANAEATRDVIAQVTAFLAQRLR